MPTPFRIRSEHPAIPSVLDRDKLEAEGERIAGWYYLSSLDEMEVCFCGRAFVRPLVGEERIYALSWTDIGRFLQERFGLEGTPEGVPSSC